MKTIITLFFLAIFAFTFTAKAQSQSCPGDLNNSGGPIDVVDLMTVLGLFGQECEEQGCNEITTVNYTSSFDPYLVDTDDWTTIFAWTAEIETDGDFELEKATFILSSYPADESEVFAGSATLYANGEPISNNASFCGNTLIFYGVDLVIEEGESTELLLVVGINDQSGNYPEGTSISATLVEIGGENCQGETFTHSDEDGFGGEPVFLYFAGLEINTASYISYSVVEQPDGGTDVYFAYTTEITAFGDDLYIDAGASGWEISFGNDLEFEVTDFNCVGCAMDSNSDFFEFEEGQTHSCSIWGIVEDVPSGTFECTFTALNFYLSPSLGNPIPYPTEIIEPFSITVP